MVWCELCHFLSACDSYSKFPVVVGPICSRRRLPFANPHFTRQRAPWLHPPQCGSHSQIVEPLPPSRPPPLSCLAGHPPAGGTAGAGEDVQYEVVITGVVDEALLTKAGLMAAQVWVGAGVSDWGISIAAALVDCLKHSPLC